MRNRRKSAPPDFSLNNRQLSWVYDSLKGQKLTFATLLGNSNVFPQFQNTPAIDKRQRRLGSKRPSEKEKKRRNKAKEETKFGTLKAICPFLPVSDGRTSPS